MTTHECMHLVMRGHFWSHDEDGGYTIQSAIAEKPVSIPHTPTMMVITIYCKWHHLVITC